MTKKATHLEFMHSARLVRTTASDVSPKTFRGIVIQMIAPESMIVAGNRHRKISERYTDTDTEGTFRAGV